MRRWINKHGGLKVTTTEMLELKGTELHSMAPICKTEARETELQREAKRVRKKLKDVPVEPIDELEVSIARKGNYLPGGALDRLPDY